MKPVDWTDDRGRNFRTLLPDDAPDEEARMGIPVGPPDVVDHLGLPEPLATRLHNILHEQGLWDVKTLRKNDRVLIGVWQRALRVDVNRLFQAFMESEKAMPESELNGRG